MSVKIRNWGKALWPAKFKFEISNANFKSCDGRLEIFANANTHWGHSVSQSIHYNRHFALQTDFNSMSRPGKLFHNSAPGKLMLSW